MSDSLLKNYNDQMERNFNKLQVWNQIEGYVKKVAGLTERKTIKKPRGLIF